jgi:hypothetical protein
MGLTDIAAITSGRFEGRAVIEGQIFDGETFETFALNPLVDAGVVLRNCEFRNIEIKKGVFQLGENVVLDHASFENVRVDGVMDVHSGVNMKATRFSDFRKASMLWIRNVLQDRCFLNNSIDLDVSEFYGELVIVGNDVSRVRIDTRRHVFVSSQLADQSSLGLNRANFFRSSSSKVKVAGGAFGVFSLPNSRVDDAEFLRQLDVLQERGYVRTNLSADSRTPV